MELEGKKFELTKEIEVVINGEIVGFLPKGFRGTILHRNYERPSFTPYIWIEWEKEGMAQTGMRDWEEKINIIG